MPIKKRKREIKFFMSSVSAPVIDIPCFMVLGGVDTVEQSSMCLQAVQTAERTQHKSSSHQDRPCDYIHNEYLHSGVFVSLLISVPSYFNCLDNLIEALE